MSAHYTTTGLENRKIGFWTFIGSECMLFGTLIATYLIYKGRSTVGPFPHEAWTDPSTGEKFKAILNIPVTTAVGVHAPDVVGHDGARLRGGEAP